nr:hypothetical protein [Tanacetum cinerariifolium]
MEELRCKQFRGDRLRGQAEVIRCYNCQEEGHMARQCTKPKRPSNLAWFKEKAMLAKALESGVILDEKHMAFLADNRNIVTIGQQSYVVLMAKLSSYDSAALSEHFVLNANSELICATCNECMFDAICDLYVLDYLNDVNMRVIFKSVKSKKKKVWKPTVVPPKKPLSTTVVKKTPSSINTSGKLKDITNIGQGANGNEGANTTGQAKVVMCYNCQEEGNFARQCTKPKRPKNSAWFKEKMLLTEALESWATLDEEHIAFLAENGDTVIQTQAS